MLTVGIPKEIKSKENRVGLTPEGVKALVQNGASVCVQSKAGSLSGFDDKDYLNVGAQILEDAKSVYERSDLIQKVKEPLEPEFEYFREGQILFCFLHLASQEQCDLVEALVRSKAIAIAFETLRKGEDLPILTPMSEIAGGLSAAFAACIKNTKLEFGGEIVYPQAFFEGLVGIGKNYPKSSEYRNVGKVIIFGGGVAGQAAAKMMKSMNNEDTLIIDISKERREFLKESGWNVLSPQDLNEELLEEADILIGAAHSAGARAVKVIDEKNFERISRAKKKIVMDISIDQGGNFPDARSTSYEDPLYLDKYSNLRFAVPNLPSYCSRQASEAITKTTLEYLQVLLQGYEQALKVKPELKEATNISRGKILNVLVKKAHER